MTYDDVRATERNETNPRSHAPFIPRVFFSAHDQKKTETQRKKKEKAWRFDEPLMVRKVASNVKRSAAC